MDGLDVSAQHSFGWQFNATQKKLILPNLDAAPPSAEECEGFRKALQRVERFYTEGEDKQGYQMKELKREKLLFEDEQKKINAQLEDLKKYPADHSRRKALEESLSREKRHVQLQLKARDAATEKMKVLYTKRNELVLTMKYLNRLLDEHCSKFPKTESK